MIDKRDDHEAWVFAVTLPDGRYTIYSDEEAANVCAGLRPDVTVVPLHPYDEGPARGDRCKYAGCLRNRWFGVAPGEVSMFCEEHHVGLAQCFMTQKEKESVEDSKRPSNEERSAVREMWVRLEHRSFSKEEGRFMARVGLSQICVANTKCLNGLDQAENVIAELTAKADRLEKRIMNAGHCSDAQWLELEKKMRKPATEQRKEEHHEQANGNGESETAEKAHGAARSGNNRAGQDE